MLIATKLDCSIYKRGLSLQSERGIKERLGLAFMGRKGKNGFGRRGGFAQVRVLKTFLPLNDFAAQIEVHLK